MRDSGFTLIEVMAASAIAAVVASGTMAAFVAAARMSRVPTNATFAEAAGYAQETLEGFRNLVATDDPSFFAFAGAGWQPHPLPAPTSSESLLGQTPVSRRYRVTSEDCDGDGTAGDCYAVTVRVCWNDPAC